MSAKAILVFCAQVLFIQSAFSQCTSRAAVDATGIGAPFGWAGFAPGFAYDGLAGPFGYNGFAGPYGFNGFFGPFAGPFAYDGFAGPFAGYGANFAGIAPFGFDGFAGWAGRGLGYEGLYPAIASAIEFTPTTSGGLTVTSSSAIPPTGISVISENAYEGILTVAGEVPFVGTTGMEGVLPTAGAGAVNHACGNGINAMVSETTAFTPGYAGAAIANGFGPAAGYNGCGLGYAY